MRRHAHMNHLLMRWRWYRRKECGKVPKMNGSDAIPEIILQVQVMRLLLCTECSS